MRARISCTCSLWALACGRARVRQVPIAQLRAVLLMPRRLVLVHMLAGHGDRCGWQLRVRRLLLVSLSDCGGRLIAHIAHRRHPLCRRLPIETCERTSISRTCSCSPLDARPSLQRGRRPIFVPLRMLAGKRHRVARQLCIRHVILRQPIDRRGHIHTRITCLARLRPFPPEWHSARARIS